jgi:hypothetical protein
MNYEYDKFTVVVSRPSKKHLYSVYIYYDAGHSPRLHLGGRKESYWTMWGAKRWARKKVKSLVKDKQKPDGSVHIKYGVNKSGRLTTDDKDKFGWTFETVLVLLIIAQAVIFFWPLG